MFSFFYEDLAVILIALFLFPQLRRVDAKPIADTCICNRFSINSPPVPKYRNRGGLIANYVRKYVK